LSPYGFEIIWEHMPRPAIEILAPPVLPYWWGLGIHLFGPQPFLWKLWLLPFSLLLVFSLDALLHRFVRRHVPALLWMTVLSPAFLPGFNLMTDIPALSLGLFAVSVFLRAADRDAIGLAFLAGVLAGLAMQTKYTAFTVPAVMLLYAILFRRVRLGLLACCAASLVFVGWESLVVARHGTSHFLCACAYFHALNHSPWAKLGHLLLALPTLLGGLAPGVILVGLAALGRSRRLVLLAGAAVVLGYLLLLVVPESWAILLRYPQTDKAALTLSTVVYGTWGASFCLTVGAVVCRLLRRETAQHGRLKMAETASFESVIGPVLSWPAERVEWFLVGWLGLEVIGYLVLSPFPAARRILSLVVVSTLLVGRLAGRRDRTPIPQVLPGWVAAGGVVLGLVFYGIDWRDAWAQKRIAEQAAQLASSQENVGTVWVVGIWGFEFYAEQAGLQPLVLGRSQVRNGDRLVVYDDYFFCQQPFRYQDAPLRVVDHVLVEDVLPLRTVVGYYCGATPLRHQQGPRAAATIYQATADFVPHAANGGGPVLGRERGIQSCP
jgi:hypothetical protein